MKELAKYKSEIEKLCQSHRVTFLYAFGSVLTEDYDENSDIDLLVRFGPMDLKYYFSNFLDFKSKLESVFHRKVDLVEEQTLKNQVFKNAVERTKQLIYG